MLCSLLVDSVGRNLGCCVGWEEEERSLSETFERLGFETRFGEGCVETSISSPLSHLERLREGVEDPAPVESIIPGLSVVGRSTGGDTLKQRSADAATHPHGRHF